MEPSKQRAKEPCNNCAKFVYSKVAGKRKACRGRDCRMLIGPPCVTFYLNCLSFLVETVLEIPILQNCVFGRSDPQFVGIADLLRHTAATRLVMAGVDLATVKEILGHATIATTMRYAHPTPEHKKSAMDRLIPFSQSIIKVSHEKKRAANGSRNPLKKMVRGGGIEPSTHGFSEQEQEDEYFVAIAVVS